MAFDPVAQRKALNAFFKFKVKDLESATRAVIRVSAQELVKTTRKEMRQNFAAGRRRSSGFLKSVKAYHSRREPRSTVRINLPFIEIFQTGGTITGRGNLIIRLPPGEKLGLPRINSGGWQRVWRQIKDRSAIIKARDGSGWIVLYRQTPQDKGVPVYKFQRQVRIDKRLNFYENAERIYRDIPREIERLLN